MSLARREFLRLVAGLAAVSATPGTTRAQSYPMRPVRIIVPAPAGGSLDSTIRLIGQWLSDQLGQPFIIENRPGAATNLGTEMVVRSAPDGYTLLGVTGNNATNAAVYEKLSFNFIRDIAPVSRLVHNPLVMEVHPSLPAATVPQFIAYAKANPERLTIASSGIGAPSHVSAALFGMMTGVSFLHVPFRGDAPAVTALLGGQVQAYFGFVTGSIGHIKDGTLRALAVTTAARLQALPDVPTIAEFVPGYEATSWIGIGAPRGTPEEIVNKLNETINAGLINPRIRARLTALGAIIDGSSVAEFRRFIADETEKWAKVVKFAGIRAE